VDVLTEMLGRGEADLGVAMSDRPHPLIRAEILGGSEIVCVLPAHHRLAALREVTVADLEGETLISYRPDSLPGTLLARALAQEGVGFRTQVEIDVSVIALAFVQQGIGVALVGGLIPWDGFSGLVARPFRPQVALPIALMTSSRRPLSLGQQRLRTQLREALRGYAASASARGLLRPA
jgi:DNA-binding transcriptional LysR family regulator